jgi:hypothetical protein
VFNNPVKILQWTLPQLPELKEFSSFLCLPAHFLDALLVEFPLHRTFSSSVSFCAPFAPAQCPPGRALRILSDSVLLLNSQQSSSNCTLCICSMPTWQSSTEFTVEFCLQLCLSYTALPPRYSTTLRSSSSELLTSVPVPQHVFV